jgi:two-component system chemotaxis response regulator CheB
MAHKIRVLIVDDSAVFRTAVKKALDADPLIEVVATATDPFDARDKIMETSPDVMVCDVVMPRMNGLEFIRRLLPQYPIKVVVVSSISEAVLDAMNAGAVDFVAKPDLTIGRTSRHFTDELIEKIKVAADAKTFINGASTSVKPKPSAPDPETCCNPTKRLIAIGASTGGTEAIFEVLSQLPPTVPGILIVQHIPPEFSRMFAERLDKLLPLNVREARNGDYVEPGHVLIAPGDKHIVVKKLGSRLRVEVAPGEKVNGHCPSVDVLFHSVSRQCAADSVGVILTGMGNDGAAGLLAMRQNGARTIGQDEETSIVYGMPRVAYEIGAVERQVPLSGVAGAIMQFITS